MENITEKINLLKKEKNAVILAHYYTPPETQVIADYVGDSFYLAKKAKESECDIIVFCGVKFMGESAKILNPDKTVLMPDLSADCPMAHMATEGKIKLLKEKYSDLSVVCYINSTAELKALSDICVTSSNAVAIVEKLPHKNIFFIPDKNLGRYVKETVTSKNIILNDGYCPIHEKINIEEVRKLKELHPEAKILAHPECNEEICKVADFLGSTLEIIEYSKTDDCMEYIILTEIGVEYQLLKNNPEKKFYFVESASVCSDMKLNTPENILKVLQTGENEVKITTKTNENALLPLDRMLTI